MAGFEGWLGGSLPDTTFRIDVFASARPAPGSGEAQDFLGSLEVTTGATGQASFAVPFTAPAGLPLITATATDPQGNTSEFRHRAGLRLQVPPSDVSAPLPARNRWSSRPGTTGDIVDLQDSDRRAAPDRLGT